MNDADCSKQNLISKINLSERRRFEKLARFSLHRKELPQKLNDKKHRSIRISKAELFWKRFASDKLFLYGCC